MAQYHGPRGSKKRRLFERREADLVRAIGSAFDAHESCDIAEGLRLSPLAYFASIGETRGSRADGWRTRTTDSIIERYRKVYAARRAAAGDDARREAADVREQPPVRLAPAARPSARPDMAPAPSSSSLPRFPIAVTWHQDGEVDYYHDERDLLCNLEDFDSGRSGDRTEASVVDALGRRVHLKVQIWSGLCELRLERNEHGGVETGRQQTSLRPRARSTTAATRLDAESNRRRSTGVERNSDPGPQLAVR